MLIAIQLVPLHIPWLHPRCCCSLYITLKNKTTFFVSSLHNIDLGVKIVLSCLNHPLVTYIITPCLYTNHCED